MNKNRKIETDEIKKIELDILKFIAKVCDDNNINYFLIAGTLLGAIRHDGFIPWDDDIDIALKREDYIKLKRVLLTLNDENYEIIDNSINDSYFYPFYKVIDKRTIIDEPSFNHIDNYGIYIDVFAIDGMPENDRLIKRHYNKIKNLQRLIFYNNEKRIIDSNPFRLLLKLVIKQYAHLLGNRRIIFKYNSICSKYDVNNSTFSISNWPIYKFDSEVKPSKLFNDTTEHVFEKEKFKIPSEYDEILTRSYGDYMTPPPIDKRRIHGIIAYFRGEDN